MKRILTIAILTTILPGTAIAAPFDPEWHDAFRRGEQHQVTVDEAYRERDRRRRQMQQVQQKPHTAIPHSSVSSSSSGDSGHLPGMPTRRDIP